MRCTSDEVEDACHQVNFAYQNVLSISAKPARTKVPSTRLSGEQTTQGCGDKCHPLEPFKMSMNCHQIHVPKSS